VPWNKIATLSSDKFESTVAVAAVGTPLGTAHGKPAQANAQLPLDSHHAFRPGKQVLIDIGARWDATDKLG